MDETLLKNIKEPEQTALSTEDKLDLELFNFQNMLLELEGK